MDETVDPHFIRVAKVKLLQFLLDIKKELPKMEPSLMWRELAIIKEGKPQFVLAASEKGMAAAKMFGDMIFEKTGVRMEIVSDKQPAKLNTIVFGYPDESVMLKQLSADGQDLGVTANYPARESYLIKEIKTKGKTIITIIGKDQGLALGAKNFYNFLKFNPDYPDQYFVDAR